MVVRRAVAVLVAAVGVAGLASCEGVPFPGADPAETADYLYVDPGQKMRDRMDEVAEAINEQDSAALKAMFSPRALERATDIDRRLANLVAQFPNGIEWKTSSTLGAERQYKGGRLTEVLLQEFKVTADGLDYSFFIADFTVNEVIDPDNVGLYALGVTPWEDGHYSWLYDTDPGSTQPFYVWARAVHADGGDEIGYPGVYADEEG